MSNEFTPGPWKVRNGREVFKGARRVCHVNAAESLSIGKDVERARNNARLIAAAPDLMGTLLDLHNRLSEAVQLGLTAQEAYDSFYQEMVGAALSKATGASHE